MRHVVRICVCVCVCVSVCIFFCIYSRVMRAEDLCMWTFLTIRDGQSGVEVVYETKNQSGRNNCAVYVKRRTIMMKVNGTVFKCKRERTVTRRRTKFCEFMRDSDSSREKKDLWSSKEETRVPSLGRRRTSPSPSRSPLSSLFLLIAISYLYLARFASQDRFEIRKCWQRRTNTSCVLCSFTMIWNDYKRDRCEHLSADRMVSLRRTLHEKTIRKRERRQWNMERWARETRVSRSFRCGRKDPEKKKKQKSSKTQKYIVASSK